MATKPSPSDASKKASVLRRLNAFKIADSDSTSQTAPEAPQRDEAPSSSSADSTKSVIKNINEDIAAIERKNEDVDLEKLMEHINQLLKLREEENQPYKKPSTDKKWIWPKSSDLKKLKDYLQSGIDFCSTLKDIISGPVKEILKGIGHASLATTVLLVVAYSLERYEEFSSNKEECLKVLKEMCYVANLVKIIKESPKGLQNELEEATTLIVEGSIICCAQIGSSSWKCFLIASENKDELSNVTKKLDRLYQKINLQIGFRVLTAIESKSQESYLWREYPTHAVGIDKSITEVLDMLKCESEEKAVTVILHGLGGTGKTTLADAVISRVGGCKYSHVQLFEDVNAKPHIVDLQKQILKDLMGTEEPVPDIRKYQGGQQALERVLRRVEAFIYIDNVLEGNALKHLLPEDMGTAKKVRLLLTARDENVTKSCPRPHTNPEIYRMKGIPPPAAMVILEREIKKEINENQFKDIIEMCGEIPLMLTLAAPIIGRADNKQEALALMLDRGKWGREEFEDLHYAFAYEALPDKCKDPFLDICSFFKGWDWETVANIVGEEELGMLRSRALVIKGTNGAVIIHDVILSLGLLKAEGTRFTTAKQIEELLDQRDEKKFEGVKGIWLTGNKVPLHISASKLDFMYRSLRVLSLGKSIKVDGKCNKPFEKLVFLQGAIPHLPFDMSKSEELRYLKYEPEDLNFAEIPSSLRHLEFDGRLHSRALEISSGDLQQLWNLRILRLTQFKTLTKLPEELGAFLNGLQELTLSGCTSLEELPGSISMLQSLKVFRMDDCSSLSQLPKDFGSLSSLQELDLEGCEDLEALPNNFEKLTALRLLDLSSCERLLDLPHGLGNLTSLAELYLDDCCQLRSIPESIGQMTSLAFRMDMSGCSSLKELPDGFCNLSFITNLLLDRCSNLEKLPDRFGELESLRWLGFEECASLKKLPEGFGQLKCLKVLSLLECSNLEELCNDFHCLGSLEFLDFGKCHSLNKLPDFFHRLAALRRLLLSDCPMLEGKEMDNVLKINTLQLVKIDGSKMLLERWAEIQREGNPLWSFVVDIGEDLPQDLKENIEANLSSDFDFLLSNGEGGPFHLSDHLREDSLLLVMFDFGYDFLWPLFEDTIDEIQTKFEIIYIGNNFNEMPKKVKGKIVGHGNKNADGEAVYLKMVSTLDNADQWDEGETNEYFQMRRKMVGEEKGAEYHPCCKPLRHREVEELLLSNCRSYHTLTQLVDASGESNIELLRELFASGKGEAPHIFQKNYASQQVSNENSKPFACGVEELKGKMIFLEMRPIDMCYDIRLGSLIQLYNTKKEALNLEIISIPLLQSNDDIRWDAFEQFSGNVPWLVLHNPSVITRVVKYFLIKECLPDQGSELWDEERWIIYPSIITIIKPNGKIYTPCKPVLPLLDRWGVKAYPFTVDKIKELEAEERSQLETMSNLEFLFHNQESLSYQVKKALLQQKMICLFGGNGYKQGTSMKEFTCFVKNALREFSDSIHIIYIPGFHYKYLQSSMLTDVIYLSYNPLQNPDMPHADMEEIPLLNLSEHDAIRFWTHLASFKLLERNDNDKQWDGLKRFIHPFKCTSPWMILIDKDGEMVTKDGREIVSLYKRSMEDASKGLMQVLIMGSKEEKQQALLKFDDDDDEDDDDDDDDDEDVEDDDDE